MQFSPTAETMHADALFYNERLDALRDEATEAQENDQEWLDRWERPDYEENRLERSEYLDSLDTSEWEISREDAQRYANDLHALRERLAERDSFSLGDG